MVHGDIHLLFATVEVKLRQKVELHLFLNGVFLLSEYQHVGLVDNKLRFGQFVALEKLVLYLYYVG